MSRLLAPAAPVAVETVEGLPARLRVEGREHQVERILAHWRLESDWWRVPLSREYWKLWLRGDLVCELYQDRRAGDWRITRWYD